MGQQQLLLVILVTIIVGIATVVAINTFGSAADNANLDAVRNDMAQIASSAQGYYIKPGALGGGGNTFTGLTFDEMAFPTDGTEADGTEADGATSVTNGNGAYDIGTPAAQGFTVTATPAREVGTNAEKIAAFVGPDCINIGTLGGTAPTTCN